MNTYVKFCPNVFLAKCDEKHEKGEVIEVTTKYGNENESIVFNLIFEKDGFFYYSIVRADGFNVQEWAKQRAERRRAWAESAERKSKEYFDKAKLSIGINVQTQLIYQCLKVSISMNISWNKLKNSMKV